MAYAAGTRHQRRRQPHHGEPGLALEPCRSRRSASGWVSMRLEAGGSGAEKAIARALARQKDAAATAEIASTWSTGPKGWAAYGAIDPGERTKALDDLGFSRQLVFTTFAGSQFLPSPDPDVKYGGARALNRAMADFCAGDKRLIGVGVVPLDDPERALDRDRRGDRGGLRRDLGSGGAGGRALARPPGPRPGLAPAGGGRRALHAARGRRVADACRPPITRTAIRGRRTGWAAARTCAPRTISRSRFAPQNFLCALALDGVFDRFPTLRGGRDRAGRRLGAGLPAPPRPGLEGLAQDRPGDRRPLHAAVGVHPPRGALHAVRDRERRDHHPRGRAGALPVLVGLSAPGGHEEPDRTVRDPASKASTRT